MFALENIRPKPFVKWVGGKRSLIKELLARLPKGLEHSSYYEPFVGGGALFYELFDKVQSTHISDLNLNLILSYQIIKSNPAPLIEKLKFHKIHHNEDYYYQIRAQHTLTDPIANTARFIYLLKTCFNGLYRVNKNNEFNTPMGDYVRPNIVNEINIYRVNKALQNTSIKYQDFSKITPDKGDFVYFDPPYHPTSDTSFVKYVSNGFDEKSQKKLRDFSLELNKNGVKVMLSNSDSDFIYDLYKKHFVIHKVFAPRMVNCKADKRKSITELLITNYE